MREQFDSLQEQHGDKVRQLQRLQSEVTSIALNDDGIQGSFLFFRPFTGCRGDLSTFLESYTSTSMQ